EKSRLRYLLRPVPTGEAKARIHPPPSRKRKLEGSDTSRPLAREDSPRRGDFHRADAVPLGGFVDASPSVRPLLPLGIGLVLAHGGKAMRAGEHLHLAGEGRDEQRDAVVGAGVLGG